MARLVGLDLMQHLPGIVVDDDVGVERAIVRAVNGMDPRAARVRGADRAGTQGRKRGENRDTAPGRGRSGTHRAGTSAREEACRRERRPAGEDSTRRISPKPLLALSPSPHVSGRRYGLEAGMEGTAGGGGGLR